MIQVERQLTRKKGREDKACLCKDNSKEDGICGLSMLCYDGAQVLVQMENKISQPCITLEFKLRV